MTLTLFEKIWSVVLYNEEIEKWKKELTAGIEWNVVIRNALEKQVLLLFQAQTTRIFCIPKDHTNYDYAPWASQLESDSVLYDETISERK